MDQLTINVQDLEYEGHRVWAAAYRVNGCDFIELVRAHEQSFAEAEGSPEIAGAYGYFPAASVLPPSQTLLGAPGEGCRVALLMCTCGDLGCWPLYARVRLQEDVVIWEDFEQPHRGPSPAGPVWDYAGFGPFRFLRAAYEKAILQAGLGPSE